MNLRVFIIGKIFQFSGDHSLNQISSLFYLIFVSKEQYMNYTELKYTRP